MTTATSTTGAARNSQARKSSANGSNASHLARIRENQRRSRARRKEYLQELEVRVLPAGQFELQRAKEKFRKCEQAGVEASHEMQQAAKRVLEENRRLRVFLLSKGIKEHEIDRCLSSEQSAAAYMSPLGDQKQSSATQNLEVLLSQRRPCPVDSKPREPTNETRRSLGSISTASSGASPTDMTHMSSVTSTMPSPPYSQSSPPLGPTAMSSEPSVMGGLTATLDQTAAQNQNELQQQYIQGQLAAASMLTVPVSMANESSLAGCLYPDLSEPQLAQRVSLHQTQQGAPFSWPGNINTAPCFLQQDIMSCQDAGSRDPLVDNPLVTSSFL